MFVRALIVLLAALNLGVAAWWALQPAPVPAPPASQPPGIPRLQLLSERQSPASRTASTRTSQVPATNPLPAIPSAPLPVTTRCFTLGPFTDDATVRIAATRLRPQVANLRTRGATATPASGYNVVLPPLATRELAQATAARIIAAGFSDLMVINQGPDTNGIALGRYGVQDAAIRHQTALQAAGFAAQLRPIGGGAVAHWLDVQVREGFDIAAARARSGAPRQQTIDCTSFGSP